MAVCTQMTGHVVWLSPRLVMHLMHHDGLCALQPLRLSACARTSIFLGVSPDMKDLMEDHMLENQPGALMMTMRKRISG